MTALVCLEHAADYDEWRQHARHFLSLGIDPSNIVWRTQGSGPAGDLFADTPSPAQGLPADIAVTVPRAFHELARTVICHREPERFALLYRLLWRLRQHRHLLDIAADPDVNDAEALAKAVRRDKHKMTAFVRFREVTLDDGTVFVSWFEPENHIVEAAAPFFVRRFAGMRWSILTPERSAHWDGAQLTFSPGAARADAPEGDRLERYWRTYFASIFNPARLNTAAMQREMPKRYWKNMPEAALIPELVRGAARRTEKMIDAPATTAKRPRNTALASAIDGDAPQLTRWANERPLKPS